MSELQAEIALARDEQTGEELEVLIVPEGHVAMLMTREEAGRYAEWTECKAVRVRVDGDTLAALEISDDLDYLTDPEADQS